MVLKISSHDVEIAEIITETPETKTFRFDLGGKDFSFTPGQFMMLTIDIPGKGKVTRPYSIASSPLDDLLDLTVKKFDQGVMTPFLCASAKAGDACTLKGPYGMFTLDESAPELIFIAAGSGIAPFRSMWRYVEQKKLPTSITILYSSKTAEYIIFKGELDLLAQRGVRVVHTLTRNQDPAWHGLSRRIDRDMLLQVVKGVGGKKYYLCGPPPMCHGAADDLKALGVDPAKIKMEKFD